MRSPLLPEHDHGIEFTFPVIGRIPVGVGLDIVLKEQCLFGRTQYVGAGLPSHVSGELVCNGR